MATNQTVCKRAMEGGSAGGAQLAVDGIAHQAVLEPEHGAAFGVVHEPTAHEHVHE
jgi:hypothetical protein